MGYISLLANFLSSIIGITSYYCVVLKIGILHDAIKTIQNGVFVFFLKKITKTCSFLKKRFFLNLVLNPYVVTYGLIKHCHKHVVFAELQTTDLLFEMMGANLCCQRVSETRSGVKMFTTTIYSLITAQHRYLQMVNITN